MLTNLRGGVLTANKVSLRVAGADFPLIKVNFDETGFFDECGFDEIVFYLPSTTLRGANASGLIVLYLKILSLHLIIDCL